MLWTFTKRGHIAYMPDFPLIRLLKRNEFKFWKYIIYSMCNILNVEIAIQLTQEQTK